jgi:hypothetical protein
MGVCNSLRYDSDLIVKVAGICAHWGGLFKENTVFSIACSFSGAIVSAIRGPRRCAPTHLARSALELCASDFALLILEPLALLLSPSIFVSRHLV